MSTANTTASSGPVDTFYECSIVVRRCRGTPSTAATEAYSHIDISNIIRGGPRKAKYRCELGQDGNQAMNMMEADDLDFVVMESMIPGSFLEQVTAQTEWAVQGGKHGTLAKIRRLKEIVMEKEKDIKELEDCLDLATQSIKSFHEQQKQLYNDFVTLRDKYDVNKKRLRDLLWGRLATLTREFAALPQIQEKAYETENDIEQYRMGNILGSGEFAQVRAASVSQDVGSVQRKLAIKVIDKERITTIKGLERAVNEIRILREASHPNILILFDVIQTKKYLYLVVERGHRDLYDYLEEMQGKGTHVDETTMKSLMKQLVSGLDYLHDMNVCHRDIKPENLLIIEGGNQSLKLKLLDFGMCTVTGGGKTLTEKAGTPGFMAPEMILAESYDGFISDMFSAGCVFLELVIGHQRFEDFWMPAYDLSSLRDEKQMLKLLGECIISVKAEVKKRISEKGLSGAGEDLLLSLLDFNPQTRPSAQTAFQHRWVGGKPKLTGSLGAGSLRRTRRTRSTNDLMSLDERSHMTSPPMQFPHERKDGPDQADAEANGTEKMSGEGGDAAADGGMRRPPRIDTSADGQRRRQFLPPVEPLTPSVAGAKTMLDEGQKLLSIANANNAVKRSNPTPMSPISPLQRKRR